MIWLQILFIAAALSSGFGGLLAALLNAHRIGFAQAYCYGLGSLALMGLGIALGINLLIGKPSA